MAESTLSSTNPWSTGGSLLGMRLGDPQSGLVLARRHGLLGATSPNDQVLKYLVFNSIIGKFIIIV